MLSKARPLCRAIQALALLALLASIGAMGLFGTPPLGRAGATLLALLAIALLVTAGLGLRRLAELRAYAVPEFEAALLRSIIGGMIFLAAVYHLSWVMRTFAIIHVSLDRLMPLWADHVLGLAPSVLIVLAAERILRHTPGADGFRTAGKLKSFRPRAGQTKKKSKGGLHG
ncbi:hypothetical protein GCM10008024_03880 [Allgaiera indica]|nr:hypothetical protein GCM10008024_03880 [Allgaiera indica]